jgi:glycosyltransferase involved in cell wall biosynthesis
VITRPRRAKLLYLVSEDWYFVSHRLPLAVAAQEAGYDVVVATRVQSAGAKIRDAGLRLVPIPFERAGLSASVEARTLATLLQLYRTERPDIAHHVAVKPSIYGSLAARLSGTKAVVNALMGLGFVYSSNSVKARALRPLVSRLLKSALTRPGTRTIVQNRDDLAFLRESGLAPEDSLRLIAGSGVDPAHYPPTVLPGGVPIVVFPSRLLKAKGVLEFAEAARRLKADGVTARFALVGAPDLLNPGSLTEAELADLVAGGAVEHWGWRTDMPAVLAQCQLVCLPSTYGEGVPKSLIEAAAAGRAIVTTDMPGCRDIVRHGETGWLVPARDVDALTEALRFALAHPDQCAESGAKGRDLVLREFTSDRVIRATLEVYRELSEDHSTRHETAARGGSIATHSSDR